VSAEPKTVSVEFTEPEARALLALVDAAVKALGMQAAEAGLVIHKRVVAALEAKPDGA